MQTTHQDDNDLSNAKCAGDSTILVKGRKGGREKVGGTIPSVQEGSEWEERKLFLLLVYT